MSHVREHSSHVMLLSEVYSSLSNVRLSQRKECHMSGPGFDPAMKRIVVFSEVNFGSGFWALFPGLPRLPATSGFLTYTFMADPTNPSSAEGKSSITITRQDGKVL